MTKKYLGFEHKSDELLSPKKFIRRQLRFGGYAALIIIISLLIGVVGYHVTGALGWMDSLLNASMILTGMGPVNVMTTASAKLFASCYALYSGVAFLTTISVFLAPILHRILHSLHLEK